MTAKERLQTEEKRKSRTEPWGMFIFRCREKDKASEKEKGQIRKIGAEPGTKNVMV